MSVASMGIVAGRTAADAPRLEAGASPTALLNTIGKYIPSDVTTAYIAAAGSMALVAPPVAADTRRAIAIAVAIAAAFATWVLGHRKALETKPNISPLATLLGGWFEIVAAAVAFMIWSAAIPDSWYDWGSAVTFLPALVVVLASILIGGLAVLLNRNVA